MSFNVIYDQDGLRSVHNHDFMIAPDFIRAYSRGMMAANKDYRWHWRVHVGLWAADTVKSLEGDYVECGVNRGFMSSAIMEHLGWDTLGKTFFLLDTFQGLSPTVVSSGEEGVLELHRHDENMKNGFYTDDFASVEKNFSSWKNTKLIQGVIPNSLNEVESKKIAFLHLDLNCAPPEVAAFDHFWPKLVQGGMILLDDYAFSGYEGQKRAMDECVTKHDVKILSMPAGQGLIVKLT